MSNEKRIYLAHSGPVTNELNKTNKSSILFIAILYHWSRKGIVDWYCTLYCLSGDHWFYMLVEMRNT